MISFLFVSLILIKIQQVDFFNNYISIDRVFFVVVYFFKILFLKKPVKERTGHLTLGLVGS